MGSESVLKLPLIDFSELGDSKPGSRGWDSVQSAVRKALEEYGCFEAFYDKVTVQLHDEVFHKMEEMFNLPAETKCRFVDPAILYDGYLSGLPPNPLNEAMGMHDSLNSGAIERLADLLWPEGNTKFCELLNTYVRRFSELDYSIRKMVFRSFGVEHYLESHVGSTKYSLRLLKYEAPKTDETKAGSITHYDINFVTILQQNHVNGLEVQTKNGDWIKVAPSASSSIVMIGESFLGWSNGRLYCPRHRVMMSGHEARHSIGIFSSVEGTIRCPDELVDEQHPLLFKPFDADGLVRIYATPEGQNGASALKTFYSTSN
ncbi:probable 2-oxoglutarate-dependent dioxygenase AOP1 [Rhodamnia argentea]|uniref:Probable 2-oxoglutarate-dependent dioxygenase AOP1 n=1 Tax=Rhodamnia argentea TaxID=178133 RepID=A0A8B8QSK5_9MYRT|nr:probable 2-oxoglutarate-dependent dioxygenase AOP1 [Rhodamnia argentea]